MKKDKENEDTGRTPEEEAMLKGARTVKERVGIFAGLLLLVAAVYLGIVSISYFANCTTDQSAVENNTIAYLTGESSRIGNTGGPLGAYLSHTLISGWLGLGTFILIFYMFAVGLSLVRIYRFPFWTLTMKCLISAITLSMVLGFFTLEMHSPIFWGGYHGHYLNKFLVDATGIWGALFVDLLLVALTILLFYNDLNRWYRRYRKRVEMRKRQIAEARHEAEWQSTEADSAAEEKPAKKERKSIRKSIKDMLQADSNSAEDEKANNTPAESTKKNKKSQPVIIGGGDVVMEVEEAASIEQAQGKTPGGDVYDPTAELSRYRFPSLDLLTKPTEKKGSIDQKEQEENKDRITKTLNDYGIEISQIKATVGPTVTLYEIVPAEGVRIAKIKRLEDDIALSLSALGIRIIAPIPGKGTIGIEVPNKDPQVVPIRSILGSKKYRESKMELPMAIGSTISNEVYIADLTKMPHLLVAGATGMGKSVGLNTIIASLLYKKHPSELKFVLVDPKMVEFSLYAKLERHYLAKLPEEDDAIITDPKKVVTTLNSLCVEMDNRYNLLKAAQVRNIKEYNEKFRKRKLNPENGHFFMPYIVVIVDEFADLIMTAGKEVETPIARLAQKARAVGIHLILATQRPSTNVITGIIKANFPGRVAFRVTQMVDSRTILDRPGAERLIGRGDMLFSRDGDITRLQCAFIDTPEVEEICDAIDEQVGYETAYKLPEYIPEADGDGAMGGGNTFGERDPLFDEAARAVVTAGLASTSSLQRRYSIGYNRAGKIMDQMEAAGIVGPAQGGKPRSVLVDIVTLESILGS